MKIIPLHKTEGVNSVDLDRGGMGESSDSMSRTIVVVAKKQFLPHGRFVIFVTFAKRSKNEIIMSMEDSMNINSDGLRKLPIGIQSFEELRREGYLYVDKTALVYDLVTTGKPYFLSRPRRFGKSLLLSTLEAYFKGKKELFEGLAIGQLEKEWKQHPVLHLDLNAEKYDSLERLEAMLEKQLVGWETLYQVDKGTMTHSGRFSTVIEKAKEQTGLGVVVLIDEYDKPLLRTFHDEELQKQFRSTLMAFYTVLKSADPWLKFVFITGVTKFAQVGVFSELNQLKDISMHPRFTTLCGLTQREIADTFAPELYELAEATGMTAEQAMEELTHRYDGYSFEEDQKERMYNPFSVLSALDARKFGNYWFATGTPTFLAEMLKETHYDLRKLDGIEVTASSLTDDRANARNPVAMIYQSGYLTIKDYNRRFQLYTLGYPNDEVRYGFLSFMTPYYTGVSGEDATFNIQRFIMELESGQVDAFLQRLRAFFADIPYDLSEDKERHYQVVFYLVAKLMGQFTQVEVRSARGRADMVVKTDRYIYVFEFKLDGTVEEALAQIDDRGYLIPYSVDGRELIKIGANFSKEKRNIDRWEVVR